VRRQRQMCIRDRPFCAGAEEGRMRRWRVLPDLRRVAASVNIRIIPPHKPDSTANTASPNCPLPYLSLIHISEPTRLD
ncbi:hypothetical protein ACX3VG_19405, partial [Escherichia coli]